MKAIMLSIKPEWVEKILNGEKTIEIRKTMPKCELPVKVYIYQTKGKWVYKILKWLGLHQGKVVAEFTLKEVYKYGGGLNPTNVLESACMTFDELVKYQNYKPFRKPYDYLDFYAWHISDLKIYDKSKELSEFSHYIKDNECAKKEKGFDCINCDAYNQEHKTCMALYYSHREIKRPPQSWCYVEELEVNNG